MGLKNKREAILEFIRVPINEADRKSHKFISKQSYEGKIAPKELKDVEPYN